MRRPSVWFYVGVVGAALLLDVVVPVLVVLGAGLALSTLVRVASRRVDFLKRGPVPESAGVLVTGASRGFGRRFALGLARAGYVVYATVRKEEDGRSLVDAWKKQAPGGSADGNGGDIRPVMCDVAKRAEVEEAARWVERDAEKSRIELMAIVNNAGIQRLGPLEAIDEEFLRYGFDVNVFGALNVTRAFLPHLRRWQSRHNGGARVVFIGSAAGLVSLPYMAGYCATKHAVEAIADGFRRELAHEDIKITLIEPGSYSTNIVADVPDTIKNLDGADEGASAMSRYRKPYIKFLRTVENSVKSIPDPAPVVDLLLDVLRARFPPARAVVGLDAYGAVFLGAFLPDSVMDFFAKFIF